MTSNDWIDQIVARFGMECRQILGHVSEDEAAIRRPVENLLMAAATHLGLELHLHPEARRPDLGIRPDLAARIGQNRQRIVGYVELKSPGKADISPGALRGNDRKQWEGMSRLPNLIYTNGQSWMLYRLGQQRGESVRLTGDLYRAGTKLHAAGPSASAFERLLRDFLSWQPEPVRTVGQLVGVVAPLCRLLRIEVVHRLEDEARGPSGRRERPFTELAKTWENVLFPRTDERDPHVAFADRYAQTVTFALLLARAEDISLTEHSLHEVGRLLGADHTVMGRALQILTDHVGNQFRNSLDMLVRVIDAVDWAAVLQREPDAHIHLYEHFLQEYDPSLRKASGTYYTPAPLVDEMVRLVDEILRLKLDCQEGFADERVAIIDPAMGTGTFLSSIIDLVAERRSAGGNLGFRAEAVEELSRRLIGFEKQMAAYAVAQMRIAQTLRAQDAHIRLRDLRLHLTDTLADPWRPSDLFAMGGAAMAPLRMDVEAANAVKREERLTVVIGNPPDRERAQGEGGWIESGSEGHGPPLLDRFRLGGTNGRHENKLKNLYVYFWRWATHKVFEQHYPDHQQGVVGFVSTAGFLRGPAFQRMREYLRSTCSEGWIIDLTPEGKQPPVSSRFFPGVQRELAVAIFVRRRDSDPSEIAPVRYVALHGDRAAKAQQLRELTVGGTGWRPTRADWYAPFTPAPERDWDTFPAVGSLLPWHKPGFNPNRTWVVGPDPDILRQRWERLVHESDEFLKRSMLKETADRKLGSAPRAFPGHPTPRRPLVTERDACPEPVRIARRSFDRQWLIPDSRVIDRPRPDLWQAQRDDQLFVIEQHRQPISSGPALVFTSLVPDVHYFNNNGGRVLPLRHADGSPNTAPGLLEHLANSFGLPEVPVEDLAAYIAGTTAHPAFTEAFVEDLNSLGVRVPLTADRSLWQEAVRLGRRVLWASTFGERYADSNDGRPPGSLGVRRQAQPGVTYTSRIAPTPLPDSLRYDEQHETLTIGTGVFTGVSSRMRNYEVGHRKVLDYWVTARGSKPTGRIGSPLDLMHSERWRSEWSTELVEILSVLRHLTSLEPEQAALLERVLVAPLIDVAELTRRGVLEPPGHTASPRPAAPSDEMLPGMADVDGLEASPVSSILPALDRAADPSAPSRGRPFHRGSPSPRGRDEQSST
ncbi:type ISP restriction/modification enzyme [Streptomyces olivochromogenes]|uniref:type ISP restriction/modification enzyme n=1 Tax=Streptomyces olivochromogenes TaxID=1963 RepID=UPI0036DEACD3